MTDDSTTPPDTEGRVLQILDLQASAKHLRAIRDVRKATSDLDARGDEVEYAADLMDEQPALAEAS